jgi:hypothetical protein
MARIYLRDLNLEQYSVPSTLTRDFFPLIRAGVRGAELGFVVEPAVSTGDEGELECSEMLTSLLGSFKESYISE